MNIALYCATPYHVVMSLIIASNGGENDKFDLYILEHFDNLTTLEERLKGTNLFNKIQIINQNNSTLFNKFKRFVGILIPPKEIRDINKNFNYDKFFFFALDFINISLIVKKSLKKGKSCTFLYGDDGLGSYVGNIYTPKDLVKKILKFCNRLQYLDRIDKIALLCPDLAVVKTDRKAECIFGDAEYDMQRLCDEVSFVWSDKTDITDDEKIIYFQTVISECKSEDYREKEVEIFKILKELNLDKEIVFKPHPRENTLFSEDFGRAIKDRRPFEALIPQLDMDKKVLMTSISTCMYTSYILFKEYPVVIVTDMLFGSKRGLASENLFEFIEKLKMQLPRENLLFFPKDIDELRDILSGCEVLHSD